MWEKSPLTIFITSTTHIYRPHIYTDHKYIPTTQNADLCKMCQKKCWRVILSNNVDSLLALWDICCCFCRKIKAGVIKFTYKCLSLLGQLWSDGFVTLFSNGQLGQLPCVMRTPSTHCLQFNEIQDMSGVLAIADYYWGDSTGVLISKIVVVIGAGRYVALPAYEADQPSYFSYQLVHYLHLLVSWFPKWA